MIRIGAGKTRYRKELKIEASGNVSDSGTHSFRDCEIDQTQDR